MVPKSELQSEGRGGTPPPNTRAQKWNPVFGACGKCANTKGPQKRVRNPDPILAPVSRNLAPSPANFLNPQIRNKTVQNKPREIYDFLCRF